MANSTEEREAAIQMKETSLTAELRRKIGELEESASQMMTQLEEMNRIEKKNKDDMIKLKNDVLSLEVITTSKDRKIASLEKALRDAGEGLKRMVRSKEDEMVNLKNHINRLQMEKEVIKNTKDRIIGSLEKELVHAGEEMKRIFRGNGDEMMDLKNHINHLEMEKEDIEPMLEPRNETREERREELGSFMGCLVSITSFKVTKANKDMKLMIFSGLVTMLGLMVGSCFSHLVTKKPWDKKGKWSKLWKAWFLIMIGGLVPLLVGGFIHIWWIRCVATSSVVIVEKLIVVCTWSSLYKIPKGEATMVFVLGVVGTGLAAGVPQVMKLIAR